MSSYYVAGPMRGYPNFNRDAFLDCADTLRADGHTAFDPGAADEDEYGAELFDNDTGSEEQAVAEHNFDLRDALNVDTTWICEHADGIVLLPGWQASLGATAECALAVALGLDTFEFIAGKHRNIRVEIEANVEVEK